MTDASDLIATAHSMREQLGDDCPKRGSILDLWLRTADALEEARDEIRSQQTIIDRLTRDQDVRRGVVEQKCARLEAAIREALSRTMTFETHRILANALKGEG